MTEWWQSMSTTLMLSQTFFLDKIVSLEKKNKTNYYSASSIMLASWSSASREYSPKIERKWKCQNCPFLIVSMPKFK